ncbi:hypothetical protein COCSADRAFT_209580 [Bipolaris sorokiniana ND90Pr]|uniref:Uncharacterized protein n=1 Tax=Cochliobolus sativus (strain ND90Pr / ATCC 201652) TaxID=665912 RepID=M2SQ74_COCSN|nr:uncharacterized protein COCSADRAFT_209580 [Bipolaris sorokiniana ND90Pr]EMD69393.1 hypothetical protein COCSADRAFT_209580 [Bipolaris sorokiniana ND90Pr]
MGKDLFQPSSASLPRRALRTLHIRQAHRANIPIHLAISTRGLECHCNYPFRNQPCACIGITGCCA